MKKVMLSQPTAGKTDEEIVSWLNRHIFLKVGTILLKGHSRYRQLLVRGLGFNHQIFPVKIVLTMLQRLSVKMISVYYVLGFQLLSGYVEEPVIISVRHIQQFSTQMSIIHHIILVDILQMQMARQQIFQVNLVPLNLILAFL